MFYLSMIVIPLILLVWFIYIKSIKECYDESHKAPWWFYLIGFILLFVPFINFIIPFVVTLCMIFDEEVKLKNGKQSIGEKIKNLLCKEF